jgi:hypothetical protein
MEGRACANSLGLQFGNMCQYLVLHFCQMSELLKRQLKTVICLGHALAFCMLRLELFVLDTDPICLLGSVPYSVCWGLFLTLQITTLSWVWNGAIDY